MTRMASALSMAFTSVKHLLPESLVEDVLPKVYVLVDKVGGVRNVKLLSALTFVGFLAFRVYWKVIRMPPHLRHLPRLSVLQSVQTMVSSKGALELIKMQSAFFRENALRRGTIKSLNETPPVGVFWIFGRWVVGISNPTDFKEVLIHHEQFEKFSFDNIDMPLSKKFIGSNLILARTLEWKHHRKIVNPAFRRNWATSIFGGPARELIGHFDQLVASNSPVNIPNWMQRITLDALSIAAFGINLHSLKNPDSPMVATYHRCMKGIFDPVTILLGRFASILPRYRQYSKDIDGFNRYISELIDKKISDIQIRDEIASSNDAEDERDLLELMISAQIKGGETFTREELRANCVAFFIAGHDTTANSLTFALYLLGMHPHVQDKVRKEVIEVLEDVEHGTLANDFPYPTNQQLNELRYLTCVIKETLRLFPSVIFLPMRELMSDYFLPSAGLHLPKSTMVSPNIWNLHHSKEIWGDDVNEFKPERWETLNGDGDGNVPLNPAAHDYKWAPFGGGQRICIGQQFSIVETRVVLSMVLLRYTWKVVGDEDALKGCPKTDPGIILHASDIMLELTRRN